MRPRLIQLTAIALASLPSIALAASTPTNFRGLVDVILGIIKIVVTLVFGLTFLYFMWTLIRTWIVHGGDAGSIEEGKKTLVVAVIALVIMISVWGIVGLIRQSLFGM